MVARWAWAQAGAVGQRDSEQTRDFGTRDESLRDEIAAVVAHWRGEQRGGRQPQSATFSEGWRITELCEQHYERISPPEDLDAAASTLPASASHYAERFKAGEFTLGQYKAAWAHIATIADKAHNPYLHATLILQL